MKFQFIALILGLVALSGELCADVKCFPGRLKKARR